MRERVAVYCGTRNLYEKMIPAVRSLMENTDDVKVYLLIEDDEYPYDLPVEVINVSTQEYFPKGSASYDNPWTYMVLMRAAMHRIFPQYDRILSLDVDTIVARDIGELWDIDIDDYYLAGCKELHKSSFNLYVNAGVMLLNLAKLRDGKGDELIKALNENRYAFNEQDCINQLCRGGILEIPSIYNMNSWTEPTTAPKIVHFAGIKNYMDYPLVEMYKE